MSAVTGMDALSVIVAALASTVGTALVARPWWTPGRKRAAALIVSLVAGVVAAVVSGQVPWVSQAGQATVTQVVVVLATTVGLAQGFHQQFAGALGRLESATSPAPSGPELGAEVEPGPELADHVPAHAEEDHGAAEVANA